MLFSILIANYNNSHFLEEALNSVINQSYQHWEVVLVDDGSTDNFNFLIEKFRKDRRMRIYQNLDNRGCGYTKRRCAELAKGELLGFLDPDYTLHPDALKIMVDAHSQYKGHSLISSTHFICDNTLKVIRMAEYTKALPDNTPYLLLNDGRVHAFASFKKKFYDQTNGISPANHKAVDQDLYYKLEEAGPFHYIHTPLYYYRMHKGSISNNGNERAATLNHYTVIEEACLRRITELKSSQKPDRTKWIKLYQRRYFKTQIFRSSRQNNWILFVRGMTGFLFAGGSSNILSYLKKLPKERLTLLRKTFVRDYKITRE